MPAGAAKSGGYTPIKMLQTPVFWFMFVMMSMMSTGGLMVITQFTSFAKSFGIDGKTTVVIFGVTLAAIPAALTFDRVTNGLTRPFFGWLSDQSPRNTMGIAFTPNTLRSFSCSSTAAIPFCLSCCPEWCSSAGVKSSRCFPER